MQIKNIFSQHIVARSNDYNSKKASANIVYNFNRNELQTDCFTFKGTKNKQDSVEVLIASNNERLNKYENFSKDDIREISAHVTQKNKKFLQDLLLLDNKKLNSHSIIELLDYINEKNTNSEEMKEKLDNYKKFKHIITGFGFRKSILSEHIHELPAKSVVDILKSNLLLNRSQDDFNSLPEAYNYVTKYFDHMMEKHNIIDEKEKHEKASTMMKKSFTNILLLSRVFDESVCNEVLYNRSKYINTIYMPRFNSLTEEDKEILRKFQILAVTDKENKSGDIAVYEISLDDKICALNLLAANRDIINRGGEGIDFSKYMRPVNINNPNDNFKVDFHSIKFDLLEKVLKHIGIATENIETYMREYRQAYTDDHSLKKHRDKFWDLNYVHLLNAPKNSHLWKIITSAQNGTFKEMIYKKGEFAQINAQNRKEFELAGIDYDKWLHPTIKPISLKFVSKRDKEKIFTIKNWNRCPQESLLDGNYTTCCTGLDKDQGESFLHFITNTATTTLEVRTEKNKVIGMSRILMAKINGKLSMVVENIEVNNKIAKHYLYDDKTKYKYREMIFDYVREFAKDINKTEKEIPIYFSYKYFKIKDIEKGLNSGKRYEDVELIGNFPNDIYINAYGGRWDRNKIYDDGDEFALHLTEITRKTKYRPKETEETEATESDSNYNYADTAEFR